jgi:predicted nucleic acid-binding protein
VKPAVLNASPLIILARAGYLDLVGKLVSPVVIPRAVAMEINAGPTEDPAVRFLAQPSWLSVVDLTPTIRAARLEKEADLIG